MNPIKSTPRLLLNLFILVVLLTPLASPWALPQSEMVSAAPLPEERIAPPTAELFDAWTDLFRTWVTLPNTTSRARLDTLGVVVLEENETRVLILADAEQLQTLAQLRFRPEASNDLGSLMQYHAESVPWLAESVQPLLAQARDVRVMRLDNAVRIGTTGSAILAEAQTNLRTTMHLLSEEQRAGILSLISVDTDGDGLTDTEEYWWCTDPNNANSDGDPYGYTDGQEVAALLDFTLPRTVRWNYGPPFGPPNAWPNFNDRNGTHVNICNDGDYDTIPDYAEAFMVGTRVGTGDSENTDGDKFDDGQELFGITFCPGGDAYCGYGSYPRTQDYSFITSGMPSWVRPPGDSPFVAAYPVIELRVDPNSIVVTTKEIHTIERTITTGEDIATGFAEMDGNSTTVGTIDTNTHNTWQEHSTTEGGIEPATSASQYIIDNLFVNSVVSMYATEVKKEAGFISDYRFLNSTSISELEIQAFLEKWASPLAEFIEDINGEEWSAAEIIKFHAMFNSINPEVLLIMLEAKAHLITDPTVGVPLFASPEISFKGTPSFYNYVELLTNQLVNAYDLVRYTPIRQNAHLSQINYENASDATIAIIEIFSGMFDTSEQQVWLVGSDAKFVEYLSTWFNDSVTLEFNEALTSGPTTLPSGYQLPFPTDEVWYYSSGPHHNNGISHCAPGKTRSECPPGPWSAIDIVPPERVPCGTVDTRWWVVAAQDGIVVSSGKGLVIVEHYGGWRTHYMHIASQDRVGVGVEVDKGDPIGHPSCEGGVSTGGHVHFAIVNATEGFVNIDSSFLSSWFIKETTHYNGTMSRSGVSRVAEASRIPGTNDISSDTAILYYSANSCNEIPMSAEPPAPITIAQETRKTGFWEGLGRTLKTVWGAFTGNNQTLALQHTILSNPAGCVGNSCANQVGGTSSNSLNYSDNRTAGQCGGSGNNTSSTMYGSGGGGAGSAIYDTGSGFSSLRVWSETSTTGEGWATSHSDLRMETTYREVTRSQVNTLVSREAWATATTVDPTDAGTLTFNYSLYNTGSDAAVNLTDMDINILIGNLPVITWRAPDRSNILPGQTKGPFGSDPLVLSLEQLAAIDNGEPIRVVLADYGYDDQLYDQNAWGRSVLFHVDDGIADGDYAVDTYLIATNLIQGETYQDTLARYFDVTVFEGEADDPRNGTITGIRTPEFDANGEITGWVARPVNERAWWEVSISVGGETEGIEHFRDMPAKPKTDVFLRYFVDSDGDGYTDRAELAAYTDPQSPESHPRPVLVAAQRILENGATGTVQLSLQNNGNFDASSVEVWAIAPDDSITINDNLIGGGGRVRAQSRVVVGARIGAPDLTNWANSTAKPYMGGNFDGPAARTYTFRADTSGTTGSTAGLTVSWSADGSTWTALQVGSSYAPGTYLEVADGVQVTFTAGEIHGGDTFVVQTALPIDTFSFTINRTPYTPPLIVVSYNDPQGNHKFTSDVVLDSLQSDLTYYQGRMRRGMQLDVFSLESYLPGVNTGHLVFNNPSDTTITEGKLFVEFALSDGTVVKEIVLQGQTFAPGPNVVDFNWNTDEFSPTFGLDTEYTLLVFAVDRQGTIIENTVKAVARLGQDLLPAAVMPAATWDFGMATQGEILQHTLMLANTGFNDLLTYIDAPAEMNVRQGHGRLSPADVATYDLTLNTTGIPAGTYSATVTLRSSDPQQPATTVQVMGVITDVVPGVRLVPDYPLDLLVTIPGTHTQGEWIQFTHPLGPEPMSLHPVRVLSNTTELGFGRYASGFASSGVASGAMFGDGSDGDLVVHAGEIVYSDNVRTSLVSSLVSGATSVEVASVSGFNPGDEILVIQSQGALVGNYEFAQIAAIEGNTLSLIEPISHSYPAAFNGFEAEYFANNSLSGTPVLTRKDMQINFDWGSGGPGGGVPSDNFSARWVGQFYAIAGTATFAVDVDDGVRVYVDDQLVIDEWHAQALTHYSASRFLAEGLHTLRVEYVEYGGSAIIKFSFTHSTHQAQILRVPHYHNVTVEPLGVLKAHDWDGSTGGVIVFRASGMVEIASNASVSVLGQGYRVNPTIITGGGSQQYQGESYRGWGGASTYSNFTSGGGGKNETGDNAYNAKGSGGGGHATPGGSSYGAGGGVIGQEDLSEKIYFGGSGGHGGHDWRVGSGSVYGGDGGGIIIIAATRVNVMGMIYANGENGKSNVEGGFGGGAGGSIYIVGSDLQLGTMQVAALGGMGGVGRDQSGGAGGLGRIWVEYCDNITGNTNPSANTQKLDCYIVEQIEFAPYNQSRLNLPNAFDGGQSYQISYARRQVFATASEYTTTLRIPAGQLAAATLDALISEAAAGDLTFNLDIGNTGAWDWQTTQSLSGPATLNSPDLAAAFNAYWQSQGAPQTGTLDVPVRVSMSKAGQVLLTNFYTPLLPPDATLTASDITFGVATPVETDAMPVTVTLHNLGGRATGGLTAAFYATLPNGRETYIGSAFVADIAANATASASIVWDTAGFTGTVPVRVVVDPYGHVPEGNEGNNQAIKSVTILKRPDVQVTQLLLSDTEPQAGETVQITLTLSNAGQATAGTQTVLLERDGITLGTQTVLALAGGASQVVVFDWTPVEPGPYRLRAVGDANNNVNEFDESNNALWRAVYVGFSTPLALDSGGATDPAYSAATGYGVVDTGPPDVLIACGGSEAYQTLRRDPGGQVQYRFDHLLPGHFYHLDITLYECDGAGRQESVYVDGHLVAGPEDLGDGQVHRLSIRLDPALYADHGINVTIVAPGIDGAVVSEVNLHDVDYRYADAGGPQDPGYPAAAKLKYGWLDGDNITAWGTLPYQSVRVDQADNELRYRFDGLEPTKRYNVHFTFWQPSGTGRIQRVRVDGLDTGLTVNTGDYQLHRETVAVIPATYATDGSIIVSIARLNAQTGAMVNEIALEEETLPVQNQCAVQETPYFTDVYGAVHILGGAATAGTVITALNPRGDVVGCFVVGTTGQYGFMRIYGEDATAIPLIPGMRAGELVAFRVSGASAIATPLLYWQADYASHQVDLNAGSITGQSILLQAGWNLMSFRLEPPVPTVRQVFNSMDGRYDRVLGETGAYVPSLPDIYNTLKEMHPEQGYYVRLTGSTAVTALFEGVAVPVTTPIPLHPGWNWIGYLPEATLPITVALQSIEGYYQRVLSLNKAFDPALPGYSTLHSLEPGKGYLIYANQSVTLTYPAGSTLLNVTPERVGASGCENLNPTPQFTLLYGDLLLGGRPAPVGSRVEVLTPRGEVAGCLVLEKPGVIGFMQVYGEDAALSPTIAGFRAGEPLAFRVNGMPVDTETRVWQDDWTAHIITLRADYVQVYLPLVLRGD